MDHCEWNNCQNRQHQNSNDYRTGERDTAAVAVQDRSHAGGQCRATDHGNDGKRTAAASQTFGEIEKAAGIIRGFRAALEDEIIASLLALKAHFSRGQPDEWVEPVDRAGQVGE